MSRASGQKSQTPSVASLTKTSGDYHKGDDVDADNNVPDKVTTMGEDDGVVGHTTGVCLEKGSPPFHPPHVFKDGGLTAWCTTLGAYVE